MPQEADKKINIIRPDHTEKKLSNRCKLTEPLSLFVYCKKTSTDDTVCRQAFLIGTTALSLKR